MHPAFTPIADREFDTHAAAHLYWRAGFGTTWENAERVAKLGIDAAVEELFSFTPPPADEAPPEAGRMQEESERRFRRGLRGLSREERQAAIRKRRIAVRGQMQDLKLWWLEKMRDTPHPLQEKLTLFWHSHFASAFGDKIKSPYAMWQQNHMLRRNALAPLETQLLEVSRNPAMLLWLDNASNKKGKPNENYARELMELFSTGEGQYTEQDVKESARAFTGWTCNSVTWEFAFDKAAHDDGEKTFLGQTGHFNGDDIIRIICRQDSTLRFLTRKLLNEFLYHDPEEELVELASRVYRQGRLSAEPLLRMIFKSRLFYSEAARSRIVKSPVVLLIGALHTMGIKPPRDRILLRGMEALGQDLFEPPDVNGWPGGLTWINSNTLLLRYNFANFLVHGVNPNRFRTFNASDEMAAARRRRFIERQRRFNTDYWSPLQDLEESGDDKRLLSEHQIVQYYVDRYLQRPIPDELMRQYLDYVRTDAAGGRADYTLASPNFDERTKGLIHLIMSTPEYQLC